MHCNKYLIKSGVLASTLLMPSFVFANNFNYNHLEFAYQTNPNAMGAVARLALHENAHVLGHVSTQWEGDWFSGVGVGFNGPINGFVDVTGDLTLNYLREPGAKDHDTGELANTINIGVRAWIQPNVELNFTVGRFFLDKDDSYGEVKFGARLYSNETFSLGIQWAPVSYFDDSVTFSVRYEF
ncbi:hypothetical protein NF212_23995 [Parasalinivibrio latis]|uniref:hypothetical protein n=1 Tax=Parasalinivibrio latis TaxID=2952610 RepID=UPI0030DFA56D